MSTAAVTHSGWLHTIKNLQCIASNLCLEQAHSTLARGYTYLANLPLRLVNDFFALREGEYYKVAFDIAAFTVLFFPYGRSTAIVIDYMSEVVRIYRGTRHLRFYTLKNVQCMLTNLTSQQGLLPRQYAIPTNLPLRLVNDFFALRERDYYKIALDVAAVTALFFPYGMSAAVLIDYISEIMAARNEGYIVFSLGENIPDCTIPTNALAILGLTSEEAQDPNQLQDRYKQRYNQWNRYAQNSSDRSLRAKFERLRDAVNTAYQTLRSSASS